MTSTPAPATLADLAGTYTLDPAHRIGFVARHAMVTKVRASSTSSRAAPSSTAATSRSPPRSDHHGRQHRHPQRAAGRAPEEQRLPRDGRVPADHVHLDQGGPERRRGRRGDGDLTIKGVTRSVTIPFEFQGAATDPFGNLRVGFEGSVVVNRKDFGIMWNAALEGGGVLVSEKVTLELDISAIKTA